MREIIVKNLFGHEWRVHVPKGATVAVLKSSLSEHDSVLSGCVLSYQSRKLKNAEVVDNLGLGRHSFLTAIAKKKPTGNEIKGPTVAKLASAGELPSTVSHQGASHGDKHARGDVKPARLRPEVRHELLHPVQTSDGVEDSFLGGRSTEGQASQQQAEDQTATQDADSKPCTRAEQVAVQDSAEKQLFQTLQADLLSASASLETCAVPVPTEQNCHARAATITARARKRTTQQQNQLSNKSLPWLLATLPLSAELERLLNVFKCLNGVYGFLLAQNIQCTWKNAHAAIQDLFGKLTPHDVVSTNDLQMLQMLAPELIVLGDFMKAPASVDEGSESMDSFTIHLNDVCWSTIQQQNGSATPMDVVDAQSMNGGPESPNMSMLVGAGSARSGNGGATGLGIQKFRKAATRARISQFRQCLVLSIIASMEQQGHACRLQAQFAERKAQPLPGLSATWPSSLPWQTLSVQEATASLVLLRARPGSFTMELDSLRTACLLEQVQITSRRPSHGICSETCALDPLKLLEHLMTLPWYDDQVCHVESISRRSAKYADTTEPLSSAAVRALASKGMSRLYCHQAAAINAVRNGAKAVVVCASTASGKSLCYNIPILEALHQDRNSCAMYIFPTKALAQDQLRAVEELLKAAFGSASPAAGVYDGDTPMDRRSEVKDNVQLLITNPDMLHHTILPMHQQFCRMLANIKYIIIDEGHYYSGVFGAHTALILRRLRRLCETEYNSSPQFIITSATVANPRPHVQELLGVSDVTVIDNDGSPHGPKSFVLWNPPLRKGILPADGSNGGSTKRFGQELARARKRMANQLRGNGNQLGRDADAGTAEWLAACKIGKRLQQSACSKLRPACQAISCEDNSGSAEEMQALTASETRRKHFLRLEAEEAVAGVISTAAKAAKTQDEHSCMTTISPEGHSLIYRGNLAGVQEAMASMQERLSQCIRANSPADPSEAKEGAAGTKASESRRSPILEMATLLAECVKHKLQTLAFCMTRKLCELVVSYTREILSEEHASQIAVYRSGYSAAERRSIERQLHDGTLRAVCATNALELGLDVGDLDATLHLGFAGSVASLWQQAGRAGRRGKHSIAVYVAFDGPLCQYFMTHPQELFGRPLEQTIVDAHNMQLVTPHVVCAAAEKPLCVASDQTYFGSVLRDCSSAAVANGDLARSADGRGRSFDTLFYVGNDKACARINLRAIDPNKITVINGDNMRLMEEIEENKAFWQAYARSAHVANSVYAHQVYPGAIYYHQGRSFLCTSLDLTSRVASVKAVDVKYYTKTADFVDVHVVGGALAYQPPATAVGPDTSATVNNAIVTTHWISFHRIWQASGKVFDTVPLHLPDMAYDTQAVFIRVPPQARTICQEACVPFRDGVHAACHALLNVIPLYVTCSNSDMGTECDNAYDIRYRPERLLIYDKHPGGIGLARQLHPMMGMLIERALELIEHCPCAGDHGCPSCVQHTACDEYNSVLHKKAGRLVLEQVKKHEVGAVFGRR